MVDVPIARAAAWGNCHFVATGWAQLATAWTWGRITPSVLNRPDPKRPPARNLTANICSRKRRFCCWGCVFRGLLGARPCGPRTGHRPFDINIRADQAQEGFTDVAGSFARFAAGDREAGLIESIRGQRQFESAGNAAQGSLHVPPGISPPRTSRNSARHVEA
jgi:hypothetical protein